MCQPSTSTLCDTRQGTSIACTTWNWCSACPFGSRRHCTCGSRVVSAARSDPVKDRERIREDRGGWTATNQERKDRRMDRLGRGTITPQASEESRSWHDHAHEHLLNHRGLPPSSKRERLWSPVALPRGGKRSLDGNHVLVRCILFFADPHFLFRQDSLRLCLWPFELPQRSFRLQFAWRQTCVPSHVRVAVFLGERYLNGHKRNADTNTRERTLDTAHLVGAHALTHKGSSKSNTSCSSSARPMHQ